MLLKHFDNFSDLKNTNNESDGVTSDDIDKCSQLKILINENNKISTIDNNTIITNENNKLSKINNPLEYINKINISEFLDIKNKANINGIYIYIFIIIALIVNIYLGLFITPFLLGGSALISFFIILLSALILFLLMYLFS
jgi:hypothetical protein